LSNLSGSTFPAATYDSNTKVITAAVIAILLASVVITRSAVLGCLSILIVSVSYAYSPRRYIVSGRAIIVKRLIGNVTVPLGNLRAARPARPDDFRGSIRLFGNGGLFGYYGLFRTPGLDKSWWYVTNRSKSLVVITAEKTVVVSPDRGDDFLAAVGASSRAS
jgi:Bacterial PH domain